LHPSNYLRNRAPMIDWNQWGGSFLPVLKKWLSLEGFHCKSHKSDRCFVYFSPKTRSFNSKTQPRQSMKILMPFSMHASREVFIYPLLLTKLVLSVQLTRKLISLKHWKFLRIHLVVFVDLLLHTKR